MDYAVLPIAETSLCSLIGKHYWILNAIPENEWIWDVQMAEQLYI